MGVIKAQLVKRLKIKILVNLKVITTNCRIQGFHFDFTIVNVLHIINIL